MVLSTVTGFHPVSAGGHNWQVIVCRSKSPGNAQRTLVAVWCSNEPIMLGSRICSGQGYVGAVFSRFTTVFRGSKVD
jgi:hypothetical protein